MSKTKPAVFNGAGRMTCPPVSRLLSVQTALPDVILFSMSTPLDYAGKLPIAKRKRSWRWLWITILCATLIVSLLFTYPTYRRSRAIRAVTSAKNAAEEAKAFILVQRTNEQYEIDFYDAAGMEIRPYVNGDYASVKSVKIIWPNGASASAPVRDQRNLIILMTD